MPCRRKNQKTGTFPIRPSLYCMRHLAEIYSSQTRFSFVDGIGQPFRNGNRTTNRKKTKPIASPAIIGKGQKYPFPRHAPSSRLRSSPRRIRRHGDCSRRIGKLMHRIRFRRSAGFVDDTADSTTAPCFRHARRKFRNTPRRLSAQIAYRAE